MIVRDAVIRLRLEQQKAKFERAEIGPAVQAYKDEAKAARESAKAQAERNRETKETAKATQETAAAVKEYGKAAMEMNNSLKNAAEGAARFTRGLVLLSTSSEGDVRKIIQALAPLQGAFDLVGGGAKVIGGLTAAFGPLGGAVGGLTLLLGTGAAAWAKWNNEAARAAEEMAKAKRETAAFTLEEQRRQEKFGRERIGIAITPEEQRRRIAAEKERLRGDLGKVEQDIRREERDIRTLTPDEARAQAEGLVRNPHFRTSPNPDARRVHEIAVRSETERLLGTKPAQAEFNDVAALEERRAEVLRRLLELEEQQKNLMENGQGAVQQVQRTLDELQRVAEEAERRAVQFRRQVENSAMSQ